MTTDDFLVDAKNSMKIIYNLLSAPFTFQLFSHIPWQLGLLSSLNAKFLKIIMPFTI